MVSVDPRRFNSTTTRFSKFNPKKTPTPEALQVRDLMYSHKDKFTFFHETVNGVSCVSNTRYIHLLWHPEFSVEVSTKKANHYQWRSQTFKDAPSAQEAVQKLFAGASPR